MHQQLKVLIREKQQLLQRLDQANRDLKHQLDLQELLYQLGQTLTLLHPSQTLERIVDAAFFLTNAEEALLSLINPRSAGRLRADWEGRQDGSVRHPGQLNHPLSRQKLAMEARNLPPRSASPRSGGACGRAEGDSAIEGGPGPLTTLSVPLENGQKTIGALTVKLAAAHLQESDLAEYQHMLRHLAGYANIALHNLDYLRSATSPRGGGACGRAESPLLASTRKRGVSATEGGWSVFECYVDAQRVEEPQPQEPTLSGSRQPVSLLFAGLRGFSAFATKTSLEKTVDTLKAYIGAAVEAILKEQGTLDKFVGDAVMAFFNAPLAQPDHALQAVRAALLVKHALLETQKQLSPGDQLDFGLGLCPGEAVVDNEGTPGLINYTVIGDSVNKARRLQEHAKDGQILLSQETLDLVQPHVQVNQIGWLHLKGQAGPEPIYELIDLKPKLTLKAAPLSPAAGLAPIAI